VVYLQENGFDVEARDVSFQTLVNVRAEQGISAGFAGCHTAVIDGYVVEGHVSAGAIKRMLEDRPAIVGLAVPGMPAGSPGMGGMPQRYNVLAIDSAGGVSVYERH
jgi:hypothetical protein